MQSRFFLGVSTITLLLSSVLPAVGIAQSYSDVPASSPLFPAVEYLKEKGIVRANPTFNPTGKLTRAEVAKILVVPLVSQEELSKITASEFEDVPPGQWYTAYAEAARQLGIVDSAQNFSPEAPVTKAAFMKMLFSSKNLDYKGAFSDIQEPLSSDVLNQGDWYYPVLRFGLTSSMTAVTVEGLLSPGRELSRGDMALLYYRLDMYLAGRRTQALLSQSETDIGNVLVMLDSKKIDQAEWASVRAILVARGALALAPDEAIVKGAVKVSEGFRALVRAFKAGSGGDLDTTIAQAKEAYALADKAKAFAPNLAPIALQMQTIAKTMANEARALKAQAETQGQSQGQAMPQ